MTRAHVEAVLERLRLAYGAPDTARLANWLDMDETTFRVWLSRGKVPLHILATASAATGQTLTWLHDGVPDARVSRAEEPQKPYFLASKEKQVKLPRELTRQEQALLDNYRKASTEGRLALEAASAALAKQGRKKLHGP
jgi:hypothetical protein